ncbi:MAG: argininosuccinate lyase, partial [Myxococcales bacterium]|nr:argininosuccinate lyase [Myxococcales bacterium]
VEVERMRPAADDPMLLATDLAEILVREGVPSREAHEAVARVVQNCLAKHLDLRELSREDLAVFHPSFPAAASELLDLERSLEARSLVGGTARPQVTAALERQAASIRQGLEALGAEESEQ